MEEDEGEGGGRRRGRSEEEDDEDAEVGRHGGRGTGGREWRGIMRALTVIVIMLRSVCVYMYVKGVCMRSGRVVLWCIYMVVVYIFMVVVVWWCIWWWLWYMCRGLVYIHTHVRVCLCIYVRKRACAHACVRFNSMERCYCGLLTM